LSHFNEAEVEGCGFKMAFLIAKTSTMAKDKNSFLIYCDIIHTVDKLDDLQAGKLFKHLLKYVNDLNPVADDIVTEIAFEPIRQSLKRDLQKYETIRERNSENAKKRWNATASDRIPNHTKNADSDSVSDSVISKDIYRSFAHLSISNADIEKLLDKYSINEIDDVLDSIENFKGNKKYTSLYLTANKWLSKNKKSTEVEEPKELLLARKLGLC
jgi:hypothetical protein